MLFAATRFYRVAWAFYLFVALGGLVGLAAQGRRIELRLLVDPASWWLDVAYGVGAGLALLALWLVVRRTVAAARRLEEILSRLLGPVGRQEVIALAVISAVAEEVAFRGALQSAVGWIWAAVIFAVLHFGPGAPFRMWSAFALAGGLAFGWLADFRQALLAPILGHLVVNLVQLLRLAGAGAADTAGRIPER